MKLETTPVKPETPPVHWKKVTLIGVGLLGGSLGLALKRKRQARRVVGFVRRRASVAECRRAGAVDFATLDLQEAVADADLIVFCTPIARMAELAWAMRPWIKPGAIVTDVGSAKGAVVRQLEPLFARAGAHFIGSHPMAGSEQMGVSAARADLFDQAMCVVTRTGRSNPRALRKVTALWQGVGARVLKSTPRQHDAWVSRSSHLPHFAASVLAHHVLDPKFPPNQARLCATGFRDTTRIASGSPEMWRDIALANRTNLRQALRAYIAGLRRMERLLARGDEAAVSRFFQVTKARRDQWLKHSRASSPE